MPNTYVNKVVYGNTTLIDLTSDDVTVNDVLSGIVFHLPSGEPAVGSCNYDSYTQDADATAAMILASKTAYVNKVKLTGTMPNIGAQTGVITTKAGSVAISAGYHDGSGAVTIDSTEQAKIIGDNIREGVTILGVVGTMSGSEDVKATSHTATPYTTSKTYLPSEDGDYNYFSQFTVSSIYYNEADNLSGGKTATIGTVAPSS